MLSCVRQYPALEESGVAPGQRKGEAINVFKEALQQKEIKSTVKTEDNTAIFSNESGEELARVLQVLS